MTVQTVSHQGLTWTHIQGPTSEDLAFLQEHYPFFHPLDLEDVMSNIQVPKVDEYDTYLFLVMHFPLFDRARRRLGRAEVDSFLGRDFAITITDHDLKPLTQDFESCLNDDESRQQFMGRGSNYLLYEVVDSLVDSSFPILNKESANIENIEQQIFEADTRRMLREISVVRRNLINYRRIVKPMMGVVLLLEHKEWDFLRGDLEVYWGDVSDHLARIWERLQDQTEVIEGLANTIDSLSSHSLSEVMKFLAIIALTLGSVEAIAGIYGMNLATLPLADNPLSFPLILATILGVVGGMLLFFRRRGWL
ncbi:MAG: magnesium transporter CorA family protein [Anaerolineae bacterium]